MTVVHAPPSPILRLPSSASLSGLDGINLFIAGMAAGFGPYVAVYLANQKWTQEDIGFVLTAGGLAGLVSQLPGGELVDAARSKRVLVAVGTVLVAISAVIIDFRPTLPLVLLGLVLQGITAGFLGPSIAAISLGLVGLSGLPDRLGRNQRFASFGNLAATGLMGLIAYSLSYRAIFATVAVLSLPTFAALARIDPTDIHFGRACGAPNHHAIRQPARARRRSLWKNSGLLILGISLFLFQLANASMLPLLGEALVYRQEGQPSLVISALIILPQIIVVVVAPWIGRKARSWGRRPLLLIGLGALPIRAVLFAWNANPLFLIGSQLLDGVIKCCRNWGPYSASYCRCYEWYGAFQPSPGHRWDRIGNRSIAQHVTVRLCGGAIWLHRRFSQYRGCCCIGRANAWVPDAGDETVIKA